MRKQFVVIDDNLATVAWSNVRKQWAEKNFRPLSTVPVSLSTAIRSDR